jgi:hypothetical protein
MPRITKSSVYVNHVVKHTPKMVIPRMPFRRLIFFEELRKNARIAIMEYPMSPTDGTGMPHK